MKYEEILSEASTPKGVPYSKLDIDNKVYIVYDASGTEVSRHPFQHVWDSSPAKRDANSAVNALKAEIFKKDRADAEAQAEAKPLSAIEQKYFELDKKYKNYLRYIYPKTPEDNILDAETREVYLDTATKWVEEMNRLAGGGTIRKSLIMGTYNPK